MLEDSTIAVGGDNDESDCFIGGSQASPALALPKKRTDHTFDRSSLPNASSFFG